MRLSLRCTPTLPALTLLALGALPILTACADDPVAPATPPTELPAAHAGRVLGLVEVTLSGLGTGDMRASARPVALGTPGTTASGVHLALAPMSGGDGTIQLEPVSTGSFTDGVRGSDGERYLYATFRVRNAQADGTPYADARTNLTFLAVSTASTMDETAISTLQRFDGSPADPAIALQVLPTGAVTQDLISTEVHSGGADVLQLLNEAEADSVAAPTGVTSVFPYGFVVRNPSTPNSRALPASPPAGQFDGVVTFAFKIPLQASAADDPFTISAMFLALDDGETRVTQSMEEQDSTAEAAFAARATALSATQVTLLPGSGYNGALSIRLLCTVRVAGSAAAPTATLDLPAASEPWLLPAPWQRGPYLLPRTTPLAVARCPAIATAGPSSFSVHGSQSGRLTGSYTGLGTPLVHAPAPPGAGFFPGEAVEVTLTTALGGTRPVVARYRVAAQGGGGGFTSASMAAGEDPRSLTAADLDGDGDVDLAVPNAGSSNTVSIFQNDGMGIFASIGTPAVGSGPYSVVAADLDSDGDLDLATANINSSTVTILQNDGTANFTPIGTVAVGAQPQSITAADLDGDGDLDLATANPFTDNASILVNDGTGAFASAGTVDVGDVPQSVVAADLDQDGDLDLAVGNANAHTVSILQNDGTGAFAVVSTPAVGGSLESIAAADLDGDGDIDLATANGDAKTVSLLTNDGTGGFASGATLGPRGVIHSVTAVDIDGDGDMDLAVAESPPVLGLPGDVFMFRNDGVGTFARDATTIGVEVDPLSITAADLDGDGDLDLAVANNGRNTVSILTNGSTP